MAVKNRRQKKNFRFILIGLAAFALACFGIAVLSVVYYNNVRSTIGQESRDYMLEISKQMSNNINRTISDNFAALQTIATSLEDTDTADFSDLSVAIQELKEHWRFNDILVLDGNAVSYDANGNEVRLDIDEYLQSAIVGKKPSMSASEQIGGKECVVFAVPADFKVSGKGILALVATYDLETFDKILSMSAFNGKAYAHIVFKDGSMVVGSSSDDAFETGYNILNSIEKDNAGNITALQRVRAELLEAKEGFAELTVEGESIYMVYLALDRNIESGNWRLLTFVPASVVNEKSALLLDFTLMVCCLITVVFAALIAVILIVALRSRKKLEQIAYVDSVTGGNTIEYFYEIAKRLLGSAEPGKYMLLYTNLEKFKLLNEQFGRAKCDQLLRALNICMTDDLADNECMGRLSADNFCLLLENKGKDALIARIKKWMEFCLQTFDEILSIRFTLEFGVYIVEDTTKQLSSMIDRAKLSLSAKSPYTFDNVRVSIYNEQMRKIMVREKQLEDLMLSALAGKEFQVYLQPKYYASTDTIGGAEALVRWNSAAEGMIYPNEFIPLFEKNGFIKELDMYMFEQVCVLLRRWLDNGCTPVKISVNCSRVNLSDTDFIAKYIALAERYDVPRELLEIEFTENIVFEDVEYFSGIITKIKSAGFGCSLDDFGSGYSSLSLIQDIPVDTIKMDKVFFSGRSGEAAARTESVVGSIIDMLKSLAVVTVAEGVEDKNQVVLLKKLGCDLIQGYYYAKPMPVAQFEQLAYGKAMEDEGVSR